MTGEPTTVETMGVSWLGGDCVSVDMLIDAWQMEYAFGRDAAGKGRAGVNQFTPMRSTLIEVVTGFSNENILQTGASH